MKVGEYIKDGDVLWIITDIRDSTCIGDIIYRPILKRGYVKLNGATVQRTDYPRLVQYATENNLFTANNSVEPWKFGNGDGETTFVLPDYRNRVIQGRDNVGIIEAGLPNIEGYFRADDSTYAILGGSFFAKQVNIQGDVTSNTNSNTMGLVSTI